MLPTEKNSGNARHFSTRKTCVICDFGLKPSFGLGIDFSPAMIEQARRLHPDLQFEVGDAEDPEFLASLPGAFDTILIVDTIGSFDDCQTMFETLHGEFPEHGTGGHNGSRRLELSSLLKVA